MRQIAFHIICLAVLTLAVSSCKSGKEQPAQSRPVVKAITFGNVAAAASQEHGISDFGLFAGDATEGQNIRFEVDQDGNVSTEKQLYWPISNSGDVVFVAYSPYNSSITGPDIYFMEVKTNQEDPADFYASDFLYARTEAQCQSEKVNLSFKRKMSRMTFSFPAEGDYDKIDRICIKNISFGYSIDLSNGNILPSEQKGSITALNCGLRQFSAIIPPQTGALVIEITTKNGILNIKEIEEKEYQDARSYNFNVHNIVNSKEISLELSVSEWAYGDDLNFNATEEPTPLASLTDIVESQVYKDVTITLKDAIVTYKDDIRGYMQDSSGGVCIYSGALEEVEVGMKINGEISGTITRYNSYAEFTTLDLTQASISQVEELPLETLTISQLTENISSYLLKRVLIEGVTVTKGIAPDDKKGIIVVDDQQIKIYNEGNSATIATGDRGNLICLASIYEGEPELLVYESNWFTSTLTPPDEVFLQTESPGVYSLSGDNVQELFAADEFDTVSICTRDNFCYFHIIRMSGQQPYSLSYRFDSSVTNPQEGDFLDMEIGTMGTLWTPSASHASVRVVKRYADMVWVVDSANTMGYIFQL